MPSYVTIAASASAELEIKRSRFLAFLAPVGEESSARDWIATVKSKHPKARHHCTAFVLGPDQQLKRTNDDGEPSGTAGAPMLDALLSAGLSDVAAVVVRYFGGVLLGASGLTRAYRAAAAAAVAEAQLERRELRERFQVRTDYASAALIETEARRQSWSFRASYGAEVVVELAVPTHAAAALGIRIAQLTSGGTEAEPLGAIWSAS